MTEFAPNGYNTLRQFLNALTEHLSADEIDAALDRQRDLRADLYAGAVTAFFIDPKQPQSGLTAIDRNFWATEAGGRSIETGRYYPMGEHLSGNPYIEGSDGTTFFIKSPKPSRKLAPRDGLPQKVGPKPIKFKIAETYEQEFPEGHKGFASLPEAKLRCERAMDLEFSESTFRNAVKIAEQRRQC